MTVIDHLLETGRVPDMVIGDPVQAEPTTATAANTSEDGDGSPSETPRARLNHNAASPEGTRMLAAVHAYIRRSGLPTRLVDLVYLRVSQLNGCAYCVDMHSADLVRAGVPVEHLFLLPVWREAGSLFSEEERAALAWAEAVTGLGEHGVPDGAFEAARAVFDEKQLSDLTIAVGLMGAYNRLAISFRTTPATLAG